MTAEIEFREQLIELKLATCYLIDKVGTKLGDFECGAALGHLFEERCGVEVVALGHFLLDLLEGELALEDLLEEGDEQLLLFFIHSNIIAVNFIRNASQTYYFQLQIMALQLFKSPHMKPADRLDANLLTKKQLLNWLSHTLQIQAYSIEQLGNGAAFCQLLDVVSHGCIRMNRVNWNAKLQHQNLANLKLLSTAMLALGIDKKFDAVRIAQRKHQEILELLQWFRKYFIAQRLHDKAYDPASRRSAYSNEKSSEQAIKNSAEMIRKQKVLNFSRPSVSEKRPPQEVEGDSELKNRYYAIKKIVQQKDIPNSPEVKLQQIKNILLKSNSKPLNSPQQPQPQSMVSESSNVRTVPSQQAVKAEETRQNVIKIEQQETGHQNLLNTIVLLHSMSSQSGTSANPYFLQKSQSEFVAESDKKTHRSSQHLY